MNRGYDHYGWWHFALIFAESLYQWHHAERFVSTRGSMLVHTEGLASRCMGGTHMMGDPKWGPCGNVEGMGVSYSGHMWNPLWTDRLTDRHDWKHYLPADYVCVRWKSNSLLTFAYFWMGPYRFGDLLHETRKWDAVYWFDSVFYRMESTDESGCYCYADGRFLARVGP